MKEREYDIIKKEANNRKKEEELILKEQEILQAQKNIAFTVRKKVNKKLSEIVVAKIQETFDNINDFMLQNFFGNRQRKLFEQIGQIQLPPEYIVDGHNYGGKTVFEALVNAGEMDMKETLNSPEHEKLIEDDIFGIQQALIDGSGVDDIVTQIQENIEDIDLD